MNLPITTWPVLNTWQEITGRLAPIIFASSVCKGGKTTPSVGTVSEKLPSCSAVRLPADWGMFPAPTRPGFAISAESTRRWNDGAWRPGGFNYLKINRHGTLGQNFIWASFTFGRVNPLRQ